MNVVTVVIGQNKGRKNTMIMKSDLESVKAITYKALEKARILAMATPPNSKVKTDCYVVSAYRSILEAVDKYNKALELFK